jgi:hypothetical protein
MAQRRSHGEDDTTTTSIGGLPEMAGDAVTPQSSVPAVNAAPQ